MRSAITSALVLVVCFLLLSFVGDVDLNRILEAAQQFLAANDGFGLGLIAIMVVLAALGIVAYPPQEH